MTGTLYAIGIGPGDPELMTLKAVRILKETQVICVPRGKADGKSVALDIVKGAMDISGKTMLEVHFPMKMGSQRDALIPAARQVLKVLSEGENIAFPTLGDPVLYSTFFHLYDAMLTLEPRAQIEIIPGVSSINASAARAGIGLTLSGQRLAVIPAAYLEGHEAQVLRDFDTIVLMKVNSKIDIIKNILKSEGLLEEAVYVSRVGMEGEEVRPLGEVEQEEAHYFSTIIVRRPKIENG